MNEIYDYKSKVLYEEKAPLLLNFLYHTFIGRILLKITIIKPITNLGGMFLNSKLSKFKIKKFIKKNNIDMSEYECKEYTSFNDFFVRTIKEDRRSINKDKNLFISPADSKLSIYRIDNNEKIKIKNSFYTVEELIDSKNIGEYKNGYALVFRLAVDDYHHYIYIDDGNTIDSKKIKGKFHTVNPIASKKYKIYSENSREVTKIKTQNFKNIVYVEVGALMVGKIINNNLNKFKKGQEKGYFCFGGSTIVILIKENIIKINEEILKYTSKDIEVKLKLGEVIGRKIGD